MIFTGKPLYPYRVHLQGSHVFKVYFPQQDIDQLVANLKELKDAGAVVNYVNFDNALKIYQGSFFAEALVHVDNSYTSDPMYIEDRKGVYNVVPYSHILKRPIKAEVAPTVGKKVKKNG
jgi:hypothetical protein